jgi:hypothetical protein
MSELLVQEVLVQPQSDKSDDTTDAPADPPAAPDVTTFEAYKGLTAKFGDSITVDKLNDFAKKAVEVVEGVTGPSVEEQRSTAGLYGWFEAHWSEVSNRVDSFVGDAGGEVVDAGGEGGDAGGEGGDAGGEDDKNVGGGGDGVGGEGGKAESGGDEEAAAKEEAKE